MAFSSGAFAGLTLTATGLYLTLLTHQRHRVRQAHLLNQQTLLLNSILDPGIVPVEDAPRFALQRLDWVETWKDRWNGEVESAVRYAQELRWDSAREGLEEKLRAWRDGGKEA